MKDNLHQRQLKTRYLVWLYKTTKERLDRIDRKFTQLEIDRAILQGLHKSLNQIPAAKRKTLDKPLNEFKDYIAKKELEGSSLKFTSDGKGEKAEYTFLRLKLIHIEKQIEALLGKKSLEEIKDLYQQEMLRRIIEEKEPADFSTKK